MTVTLPTWPGPKSASLRPVDAGSWQQATLGGDDVRLDRLGDRFALAVNLPPMKWHTIDGVSAARIWAIRLARGMSEGVLMEVPQPDFDTAGFPPTVRVHTDTAAAQAIQVPVFDVPLGVVLPEGIMVTIRKNATGRHYLHQLRATAIGTGDKTMLSLWPRTRVGVAWGDDVLIGAPVIEGRIVDPTPYEMDEIRTVGLAFEVQEIR